MDKSFLIGRTGAIRAFEIESKFLQFAEDFAEREKFNIHAVGNRAGIFSFALTVWLMLMQRISGTHSMVGALEELLSGGAEQVLSRITGSKRVRERRISSNSGGYSQARSRLPIEQLRKFTDYIITTISKSHHGRALSEGQQVFALDGTGITVGNHTDVVANYPRQVSQSGPQAYPYMRLVFAHNVHSGIAVYPAFGKLVESEQKLCEAVISSLPAHSLVIADRNFGVYSVAHHVQQNKHEILVRLTKARALALCKTHCDTDEPVTWKPGTQSKLCTELQNDSLTGRFIRHTVIQQGLKPVVLYFFTTSKASVESLLSIYLLRERIENDIRDIKHTLCLQLTPFRTVSMLEKQILLSITAYNLIRAIIADTAAKLSLNPRQISFSRAAALIPILHKMILRANCEADIEVAHSRFLTAMKQSQIYKRKTKRPNQPRKIMQNRSQRYPRLKGSRADEIAKINPKNLI